MDEIKKKEALEFCNRWMLTSIITMLVTTLLCSVVYGFAAFMTESIAVLSLISLIISIIVTVGTKTGEIDNW